jgi:transposase
MRRLVLVVLAAIVGATLYATTAPAGRQAGRSRAEFNAVKKRLFPTSRKLAGYTGLCPRVYQSGERDLRGPLAKQGPKYLRWALVEAATHARTPVGLSNSSASTDLVDQRDPPHTRVRRLSVLVGRCRQTGRARLTSNERIWYPRARV